MMEGKVSETVIAEAVGRVDKSLFMELWADCGKGVGNLLSTAFPRYVHNGMGTYPRCPRPIPPSTTTTNSFTTG